MGNSDCFGLCNMYWSCSVFHLFFFGRSFLRLYPLRWYCHRISFVTLWNNRRFLRSLSRRILVFSRTMILLFSRPSFSNCHPSNVFWCNISGFSNHLFQWLLLMGFFEDLPNRSRFIYSKSKKRNRTILRWF